MSVTTPPPAPDCAFEPPAISPRLSFKGWLLSVWLAKNKNFVKSVLAPVTAIITSGTVVPEMLRPAAIALGLGVLTIVAKLGWDAFDYFVSDVPLGPRAGSGA